MRRKIDSEHLSERLIEAAETMLVETQGRRLVLSELAARVGISQSYAHRFFPTKADLVRALAARWFAHVEAGSAEAVGSDLPAAERLELWVLTILRIKRRRYDENPALFDAYLDLAADHMDLVGEHTDRLSADLRSILSELVAPERLDAVLVAVEDATLLFRTPLNISRYRRRATDERATAVVRMIVGHLDSVSASSA
ncbi:MAG: hypothetical protein AAFX81_19740 [Pseudomonadota bacterium]